MLQANWWVVCHVMGHFLHSLREATPNRHYELPKDVMHQITVPLLNRVVLGVLYIFFRAKSTRFGALCRSWGARCHMMSCPKM
jgi:hypothetical protein